MKKAVCSFCSKEQSQVLKLIASPDGESFICDECVSICQNILAEKDNNMSDIQLAKPSEIKSYLDKFIVSQDEAKKILSVAVYNHYKRLKYNMGKNKKIELEKANILLAGPTGSGKTLLCKRLAEYLCVPFAEADATTLTETGYVGDDVESILLKLLQNCDYDVKKAERGIVYIDEIDKIAKKSTNRALPKDPTGEGVQQALLKIMEGKIANVSVGGRRTINPEVITINTKEILFICGGAFNGIDEIALKRTKQKSFGFESNVENGEQSANLIPQDFVEYGMIPEFVGRLPVIAKLESLSVKDLEKILVEPENSLIRQYKTLFKLDGIDIEFDNQIISDLAKKAYNLKTGARGLKSIIEGLMMDLMFKLPDKNISKYLISNNDENKISISGG